MAKRTVLASKAPDGHLQLLEPVDLPTDEKFSVTLELPDHRAAVHRARLVEHLTPYDARVAQLLDGVTEGLAGRGLEGAVDLDWGY